MSRIINGKKKNIVGSRIRTLRLQNGFSQQRLAERLELLAVYICRGSISRIEEHLRTVTDIELKAFSEIFHVTVNDLYDE